MIEQAVARCDGTIPRAAALLEVSPSTIYRKRQSWEQKDRTEAESEVLPELSLATETSG
jgi:DNA-binding NtrC family response regulator